jgi:hypothetical protein
MGKNIEECKDFPFRRLSKLTIGRMLYLIILLLMELVYSCTKPIDLDLRGTSSKVKVMSVFKTGQQIEFKINSTTDLDDSSLENPISNATIYLTHQGQPVDLIESDKNGEYVSEFTGYKTGDQLRINISIEGYPDICAETIIPRSLLDVTINLDTVPLQEPDAGFYSNLDISLSDPPGQENYYELEIWQRTIDDHNPSGISNKFFLASIDSNDPVITQQGYYPAFPFIQGIPPLCLPFSDASFDGMKKTIQFKLFAGVIAYSSYNGISIITLPAKDVVIHFKSISRDQYLYKTSVLRHLMAQKSDIVFGAGNPVNIIGNIDGGIGLFSSESVVTDTIHVEKKHIIL